MTRVTDRWTTAGEPPAPDTGTITLQPAAAAAILTGDPRNITLAPITCELDADGRTELEVIDSYDPGWAIAELPMPYRVTQRLGSGVRVWTAIITGDETHLGDLQPIGDVDVNPYPVPGLPGPQGIVEVESTITGDPGTDALVEDLDPDPGRAYLRFTIPKGDKGDPGPAIGGILTTKGDLVARDATTAVRVPVGSVNQVLTPDPAAPAGVRWGPVPGIWEQVALLADLPATGNWLGRKIQVTSGLGYPADNGQIMLWNGTAWVVAPESETGEFSVPIPQATIDAQSTLSEVLMSRRGSEVTVTSWPTTPPA